MVGFHVRGKCEYGGFISAHSEPNSNRANDNYFVSSKEFKNQQRSVWLPIDFGGCRTTCRNRGVLFNHSLYRSHVLDVVWPDVVGGVGFGG